MFDTDLNDRQLLGYVKLKNNPDIDRPVSLEDSVRPAILKNQYKLKNKQQKDKRLYRNFNLIALVFKIIIILKKLFS